MIKEIWQDIPDYLGLYKVSNFGRVQSLARYVPRKNGQMGFVPERELKPGTDRHGYKNVVLSKNPHTQIMGVEYIEIEKK